MEYTGSVRTKRGKNGEVSYQIVIEGERDPVTGKRMRSYQTVHCKKREAIRLMNQIVAEKNAGTYFKASHLLLRDWLEQWYRDYCTGHLEKTTLASYRDKIDHYINPVLGNIPLGKLTGQDVQQWVNQISRKSPASGNPISPKSVRNVLLVLRPALDRAVDLHFIQENPAARVVLPKRERFHPKVYADADIRKMLIAAHGTDLYFPLMLALFTGMRRGELIALRWQDVDFQGKKLYVRHSIVSVQGVPEMKGPKTESGKREIALSDRIIDLLKEQFDRFPRSEYVVCQKNGQPFSPDAFSRKFQRFLSRNHLPHFRLHDLRHASATLMIEHGVDIKTVQSRLGHSDISTTLNIYSHMTEQMNRNAADKLDEVLFSK